MGHANKDKTPPPITFVKDFLNRHGNKACQIKKVRTDQGGELWRSQKFKDMIHESGFICEPTGAGDPAQNGKAEAPNKSLARMMRAMLYNAGLSSKYWSYALVHAIYVKNRTPHFCHSFKKSPYEVLTGTKPNLSHLRVWGCRVVVKQPDPRKAKLDSIAREGVFLRYTATNKNIVYIDIETQQEKIGSNVRYDEANFINGSINPGGTALRQAGRGYEKCTTETEHAANKQANAKQETQITTSHPTPLSRVKIMKRHPQAHMPVRATKASAGLDISTYESISIEPGETKAIPTGISMSLPPNTYGKLLPRSGNTIKKNIDVKAGVIDADYTGEIKVILHNFGNNTQSFSAGDKIAQLVIEKIDMATPIEWSKDIPCTERGERGFGSSTESLEKQQFLRSN